MISNDPHFEKMKRKNTSVSKYWHDCEHVGPMLIMVFRDGV